jgi:hypothetical protein
MVVQYCHLSFSFSFKDTSGSTHLWSNCVCHNLDKTHTENRFLTAEDVLHAEDPACVLCDGPKCFGVTIGNLPARF